jgi:hypothetical protein
VKKAVKTESISAAKTVAKGAGKTAAKTTKTRKRAAG